jgi:hypothetical protein
MGDPPRKFGSEEPKVDNIVCHWGGVLQTISKPLPSLRWEEHA